MSRDLGFLKWNDPLAWMESMKGSRWAAAVKKENLLYSTAVDLLSNPKILKQFEKSSKEHYIEDAYTCNNIIISSDMGSWKWIGGAMRSTAAVYSEGDLCWSIEEEGDGKEVYFLKCYRGGSVVWTYPKAVGPFLAVYNGLCYVIETTQELRYGRCVCFGAMSGKGRKIVFEESDLQYNLSIVQGESGCVFLIADNSGRQRLYHIVEAKAEQLCHQGVSFVPVGYAHGMQPCYFARENSFSNPWKAFGAPLLAWTIPLSLRHSRIEHVSLRHKLIVTYEAGVSTLYHCRSSLPPIKRCAVYGSITINPWSGDSYLVAEFGCIPCVYSIVEDHVCKKRYAEVSNAKTRSADGTLIPYLVMKGAVNQNKLMVIVYGAYNLKTSVMMSRWKPYLDAGWTLAVAMVRGGGDYGDQWADDARRNKKYKSIEDVEAVIRAAQRQTGIGWKSTALYGRSAGGYIVGSVCSRHGNGGMIGMAYAEVPYVDVLRTTTNDSLPLTILEYDEFGNPRKRLEDFQTVLRLSPVDSLGEGGAPGIFVVASTSMNDREVLTYESMKWIQRLRGSDGEMKFLRILDGKGHFVKGSAADVQRYEDFLLLNAFTK
jgi:hypothetical protein